MSKINDGGPAFPSGEGVCDVTGNRYPINPGMSLRDWLAGHETSTPPPDFKPAGLDPTPEMPESPGGSWSASGTTPCMPQTDPRYSAIKKYLEDKEVFYKACEEIEERNYRRKLALWRYTMADEMLAAREVKHGTD